MTTAFFVLIGVICGILNIILFWKVWYMCNNVAKITNNLCGNAEKTYTGDLKIGDTVNVLGSNLNGQVTSINSNYSIGVEINGKTIFYYNSELAKV